MFEEVCLVCGKHLLDDGRAYCSDDCENIDSNSPSISSASSALSSPHLGCAYGGEVPPLLPSALGSALTNYRLRNRHSVSSSSTSSTSWSLVTDEDDEDAVLGIGSEHSFSDCTEYSCENNIKSANCPYATRRSPLSYARRPSGINNRSTVTHLHKRTSSGSSASHVRGIPRSAPNRSLSSTEDEEYGFTPRDEFNADQDEQDAEEGWDTTKTVPKAKRPRNRASLPAYFSLLQASNGAEPQTSPVSSSSGITIARASPPTPKLTLAGLAAGFMRPLNSVPLPSVHATPRGRRRAHGDNGNFRPPITSSRSSSRSPLRHPGGHELQYDLRLRSRVDSRESTEYVPGLMRGRTAVRRNSSPPPKMALSAIGLENSAILVSQKRLDALASSRPSKHRGRARGDELDGSSWSKEAPGYGLGRSGLLDRERATGDRGVPQPF